LGSGVDARRKGRRCRRRSIIAMPPIACGGVEDDWAADASPENSASPPVKMF
jgi:hypothetical protein